MIDPSAEHSSTRFQAQDILIAAVFLTRLPLGRFFGEGEARSLAAASWAFPLTGAGIGLAGGLAYAIADRLGAPGAAAALIAIAATIVLTGALHEDGLADSADGLGGASREAKLAIMRDSRTGAFGVLALIFSVGLRAAPVWTLVDAGRVATALIAAHAVSRGMLPALMHYVDPARADGLGAGVGRPSFRTAAWALGIAAVIAVLALGVRPGFGALVFAVAAAALVGWLARRHLGGQTGDVLGAAEQIVEVLVLLVASS